MQQSRLAFGPFVLDGTRGTLKRNDVPVAVGFRALNLLSALLQRPGEILGKAELMDAAWPGLVVEEGNLTVQIAQLRKVLGEAPDGSSWITTVPRVGYRFSASVEPWPRRRVLRWRCRMSLRLPCCPSSTAAPMPSRTISSTA